MPFGMESWRSSFLPSCELAEAEMCQKLIRLSFAKIVSSRNERGGAKLHRNLLILHLLQTARNEQIRSPSPELKPSQSPSSHCQTEYHGNISDQPADANDEPIELSVRDDDSDFSLDLGPLQLPFAVEAVSNEESADGSQLQSIVVVPELSAELDSMSSSSSEEDASSSSSSEEEPAVTKACVPATTRLRRRKRRTSACINGGGVNVSSSSSAAPQKKKFCIMEERHLSGLISVFNSGLSAVTGRIVSATTIAINGDDGDQRVPATSVRPSVVTCK